MKLPRQDRLSDGHELLRHSAKESDRKFRLGERPLSIVQWIGVILMFITVGILLVMSRNYLATIVLLAGLALFVVLGNLRARPKESDPGG